MAVDYISANVVLANSYNGSVNIYDEADGIRLGGNTSDYRTGNALDIYQQDGAVWVYDTLSTARVVKLAPDCSNSTPVAFYNIANVKDLVVNQSDGTVWILGRDPLEVVHISATGKPAAMLASGGSGVIHTSAQDIDTSHDGTVWVADRNNRRVLHFGTDGELIASYASVGNKYVNHVACYRPPLDVSGASPSGRVYPPRAPLATGGHPRLFFAIPDLLSIRTRIASEPWATWYAEAKARADAAMASPIPPFDNLNNPTGTWIARALAARFLAFVGHVEDNPAYIERARLTLTWKSWQSRDGAYGGDMVGSDFGVHLALAYDMAYSALLPQDKTFLEKAM